MFEPDKCSKCKEHLTYVLRRTMKFQCKCQVKEERQYSWKKLSKRDQEIRLRQNNTQAQLRAAWANKMKGK